MAKIGKYADHIDEISNKDSGEAE